jgi:hypothetical protein
MSEEPAKKPSDEPTVLQVLLMNLVGWPLVYLGLWSNDCVPSPSKPIGCVLYRLSYGVGYAVEVSSQGYARGKYQGQMDR